MNQRIGISAAPSLPAPGPLSETNAAGKRVVPARRRPARRFRDGLAWPVVVLVLLMAGRPARSASLFELGSTWKWRPGTTEASVPVDAWRSATFDDHEFTNAPAPFWFGGTEPSGTEIQGMRTNYVSIFLRKTFLIQDPATVQTLTMAARVDDGLVAWINGSEVLRVNLRPVDGPISFTNLALSVIGPAVLNYHALTNAGHYLRPGSNVLAVQVFQAALSSSDFLFDAGLVAQMPGDPWVAPVLTEFMAVNGGPTRDEDGETSDWIEIHNPNSAPANLDGWYLTDSMANLVKWRLPAEVIPPFGYLLVFASGKDRIATRPLHTNFKLDSGGEYLALVQPDGFSVATHYSPAYPPQQVGRAYGLPMNAGLTPNSAPGFLVPTPRQVNGPPLFGGPTIDQYQSAPAQPNVDSDIVVTAHVQTERGVVGPVLLNYRVMFNPPSELPMWDDGQHGDGAAGDGVYGVVIPRGTAAPGEMVRWSLTATDGSGLTSRLPRLPTSPGAGPEYFGTMIASNIATGLPVFHLFVSPDVYPAIGNDAGGRVGMYYDGEFYDNILVRRRGRFSTTFKVSHRLEFHREHAFRHRDGSPRIRETSLLGEGGDPSYLRQHLSFWLMNQMGVPAPFHDPIRLHLNGAFHGLYFHSDMIDQEMIERMGYDPSGAIYKDTGMMLPTFLRLGLEGMEKKSPPQADFSDFNSMALAIIETNTLARRRIEVFDRFDLPQVISYLAGARWCGDSADLRNTMSLFRDTFGDGLWRLLPNEMDRTWSGLDHPLTGVGHYTEGDPLSTWNFGFNRLYDAFVRIPETRAMLLRRERSLLDRWIAPGASFDGQGPLNAYVSQMTNQIAAEAELDWVRWNLNGTASQFREAVAQIFVEFAKPQWVNWTTTHSETNTALPIGLFATNNAAIPVSQPLNAALEFGSMDPRPASGLSAEEYLTLTNPMPYAVDISGWRLDGDARFTFREGTVVPRSGTLYVARSLKAFQQRATAPRGGQGLFVVGPFAGRLFATAGSLSLLARDGRGVETNTWTGPRTTVQRFLRVAEVHYHPSAVAGVDAIVADRLEFIELVNTGPESLDLSRVEFTAGIGFSFSNAWIRSLEPGRRVVLASDAGGFQWRYGTNRPLAGVFTGLLDDRGERLTLEEDGEPIQEFVFDAAWHPITDGPGFSLVATDETAPLDQWNQPGGWRKSGVEHGTPGAPDPGPLPPFDAMVVVNEVLSNPEAPWEDAVELLNLGSSPVNIGGWYLTDDRDRPRKFKLPSGTILEPGAFLGLDEHAFGPRSPGQEGLSFNATGDGAYLLSADSDGRLTGYFHGFAFGPAEAGVSFGRHVLSTGVERFVHQPAISLAESNRGPRVGPLIISEIYPHPPPAPGTDPMLNNTADEFIELRNIGSTPLVLKASSLGGAWRLRGGIEFEFPTNLVIPAGGVVLVGSIDPQNAAARDSFRQRHSLPGGVPLLGPWTGALNNQGEILELAHPVVIDETLVDIVVESIPFTVDIHAAGTGASLQRVILTGFGEDPAHWTTRARTPGRPMVLEGSPPVIVEEPVDGTANTGASHNFAVRIQSPSAAYYQWRFNGTDLPGANQAALPLSGITFDHRGEYSCVILNDGGTTTSRSAQLTVHGPPRFRQVPKSVAAHIQPDPQAAPVTNVIFTVVAESVAPTLSYQWQRNGRDLPGGTHPLLQVTNVSLDDEGEYRCVISDSFGMTVSPPATLTPLIAPQVIVPPIPAQFVSAGAPVYLSVVVSGHPLPMTFEWGRESGPFVTNVVHGFTSYWHFAASTNFFSVRSYRALIKNQASASGVLSPTATVSVLPDSDRDTLPDEYETAFGLNPNDPDDEEADADGDGMKNAAEYVAGTDPRDPNSVLRIGPPSLAGGTATIGFLAVSNRTYAVDARDQLGPGPTGWQRIGETVALPTNRWVTLEDQTTNATGPRIYRLGTPRSP